MDTSQRRILGQDLYKCVLLILNILRAIARFLAYFFHFDPPTFDAFREAARVYLDVSASCFLATHFLKISDAFCLL
jgi:hypothetical protein